MELFFSAILYTVIIFAGLSWLTFWIYVVAKVITKGVVKTLNNDRRP